MSRSQKDRIAPGLKIASGSSSMLFRAAGHALRAVAPRSQPRVERVGGLAPASALSRYDLRQDPEFGLSCGQCDRDISTFCVGRQFRSKGASGRCINFGHGESINSAFPKGMVTKGFPTANYICHHTRTDGLILIALAELVCSRS